MPLGKNILYHNRFKTSIHPISSYYWFIFCALMSALIAMTLTFDIRQWHHDWLLTHTHFSNKAAIATKNDEKDLLEYLSKTHLFGQSLSKGNLPMTNLQLHLTGIINLEHQTNHLASKALIAIANQPSKIYKIGDKLPYGVKIYDIIADTVILENNGHFEKISLPREKLVFKPFKSNVDS